MKFSFAYGIFTEMMHTEMKTEYFDVVTDENLMQNHEKGKKRQLILLSRIKRYYGLFL